MKIHKVYDITTYGSNWYADKDIVIPDITDGDVIISVGYLHVSNTGGTAGNYKVEILHTLKLSNYELDPNYSNSSYNWHLRKKVCNYRDARGYYLAKSEYNFDTTSIFFVSAPQYSEYYDGSNPTADSAIKGADNNDSDPIGTFRVYDTIYKTSGDPYTSASMARYLKIIHLKH